MESTNTKKQLTETFILKNPIPIIYLDTCILIEFSKLNLGHCDNVHKQELETLFDLLYSLMRSNRAICVLGNQIEELGRTQNRERARDFAYDFTNAEFFEPFKIENLQLDIGYKAFFNAQKYIAFDAESILDKKSSCYNSLIKVHVTPIITPEKAKKLKIEKENLAASLNAVKQSNQVSKDFKKQLSTELEADFQVLRYTLEHCNDSFESYLQYLDCLRVIYGHTGFDASNPSNKDQMTAITNYCHFLLSAYHHVLPYVRIRSVLFTHLMQRSQKIIPSDHLDIVWASAYLPFINYAVTDISFHNLLDTSGLPGIYETKIYSMQTLDNLILELRHLSA